MKAHDELVAALGKLGWEIIVGPIRTSKGWKATMRNGTATVPMTGWKKLDLLEDMLRYAQKRGGTKL